MAAGPAPSKEQHLSHANMPNVRIAAANSIFATRLLCSISTPAAAGSFVDDPGTIIATSPPDVAESLSRSASRCRRRHSGRSPRPKRAARPHRPSNAPAADGISGPERPGADPLRRLGKQRHRLGFLIPCISNSIVAMFFTSPRLRGEVASILRAGEGDSRQTPDLRIVPSPGLDYAPNCQYSPSTSLRATGSRECAPDDRLRKQSSLLMRK